MFLGTDPEVFIVDARKKPVPAFKFFPEKSKAYSHYESSGKLFRDGYALEFNVTPSTCREALIWEMIHIIAGAKRWLPEGYQLTTTPAVKIALPDDNVGAPDDCRQFGCEPAWNAYSQSEFRVNLDAMLHPFRYAGGHMHFSFQKVVKTLRDPYYLQFHWFFDREQLMRYIKMLDLYVAIPMTLWFDSEETFLRRKYYGQAGEFRFQDYGTYEGVEYRTLGPELWNHTVVASFAFGAARTVANQFPSLSAKWDSKMEDDIRAAVNTGENAEKLLVALPGFYTQEQVKYVQKRKPFRELAKNMANGSADSHNGWARWNDR